MEGQTKIIAFDFPDRGAPSRKSSDHPTKQFVIPHPHGKVERNFEPTPVFKESATTLGEPSLFPVEISMPKTLLVASALLLCALVVVAQDSPSTNSVPPPRGGMPPCLRVAGISMSQFDQLRSIAQDARAQVREVCTNASSTPQQRRQQIEDIHLQSHEKMVALVSADQRHAFMSCRARRGDRRPVEWFERPGGNCGGAQKARQGSGGSTTSPEPDDTDSPAENGPPARNSSQQNQPANQKNASPPQ